MSAPCLRPRATEPFRARLAQHLTGAGLLLFVVSHSPAARARAPRDEPWEPRPRAHRTRSPAELPPQSALDTYRPLGDLALGVVGWYRKGGAQRSIQRCPYAVSCSTYAKLVFGRYGFAGIFFFLDRFYFRENQAAHRHYRLVRLPDGSLRLDDGASRLE